MSSERLSKLTILRTMKSKMTHHPLPPVNNYPRRVWPGQFLSLHSWQRLIWRRSQSSMVKSKYLNNWLVFVYSGHYVHITAVLETAPDIFCKISDGRHWIRVKFNPQNLYLFSSGRFKEGQIIRVMTSRKDSDENHIVIVSIIGKLNQWLMNYNPGYSC